MFSGLRLAFRIARREALRYKGRSALSIALLGIPLLGASLAATAYDTVTLSDVEEVEQTLADADAFARFDWEGVPIVQRTWTDDWPWTEAADPDTDFTEGREVPRSEILAALPEGTSMAPYALSGFSSSLRVETPDGVGGIETMGYDLSDPLYETAGLEYLEGGPPEEGEIVLSGAAADYLRLGVGDAVTSAEGREYPVSGIVELPWDLNTRYAMGADFPAPDYSWLIDTPEAFTYEDALALNELGISVWAGTLAANPPTPEPDFGTAQGDTLMVYGLLVTVVVVEVVLLAGPAFAISTRRRAREFAIMSAAGAAPKHLRATVLAGGLIFGLIAAAVALTVGILTVWALIPVLEGFVGHRSAGLQVMPVMQSSLVAFAIATGLLSALAAAVSASKVNVVAALAGRTPQRKVRKRGPVIGLTVLALGIAAGFAGIALWSVPLMAGAIVGIQLGLVACTPMLVSLVAKLGRWLPLTPRMALREAGRNRGSTAPAIAAVMGVVAAGVAISLTVTADSHRSEQWQAHELAQDSLSLHLYHPGEYDEAAREEAPDFAAGTAAATQILERHLDDLEIRPITQYDTAAMCEDPEADEDTGSYCHFELVRPEAHQCVYWSMATDTSEETAAAAEAAREDPHCDEDVSSHGYASDRFPVSTDPAIVSNYSELEGAELDAAIAHLESGGVLVSDKWAITEEGTATLRMTKETWNEGGSEEPAVETFFEFPAMEVDRGLFGYDQVFLGPAAAAEMGLAEAEWNQRYLVSSSTEVTGAVQEAIAAEFSQGYIAGFEMDFRVTDYRDMFMFYFMLAVSLLCGIVALGATAVSTGLIIAESKQDMTTLGAVGAEPRVRKRFAMWQTVVIAWLGAGLGTVAGLIGYALISEALNRNLKNNYPFEVLYGWELPWVNFGISLLAVPLIAALGALLFTKARLPSERRLT
ncbi:MAG TPA: ABC transporter permease [Glycomyces sp.]|nr:ABC transporter permease [Glycomyces sp.]